MTRPVPTDGARRGHVHQVDVVRVLTFAAVIGVHTVATVNPPDSGPAGGVLMLLHFTREAFFVLTAFVLVHRYRDRAPRTLPFLRRRLLLVGVPYVVWTVVYTGLGLVTAPVAVARVPVLLLTNLVTGAAWYHLYFLLVSIQFYLVFGAFRWLLRVTRRHHGLLIAASAAAQVLIELWMHDPAPAGIKAGLLPYAGSFVLTYQFFLVAGGVVAWNLDRVETWLRGHVPVVVAGLVVSGVVAELWYRRAVADGASVPFASDVLQPVMIAWSVAVVATLFVVGMAWADRRADGWLSRAVERGSDRSFGVFLVHPAILWLLTLGGAGAPAALLAPTWSSVAVYVVVVSGSLLAVELVRRTPASLVLTGRPRIRFTARTQPARIRCSSSATRVETTHAYPKEPAR